MLDGWSLFPQPGVMVLQQLSGTSLPSAGGEETYKLDAQSWELLLPQHLNCNRRERGGGGAKWFGSKSNDVAEEFFFFSRQCCNSDNITAPLCFTVHEEDRSSALSSRPGTGSFSGTLLLMSSN